MSKKLIQSYVYCSDKCFFVSTINRESSSMLGPGEYAETMVWLWDEQTKERGKFIGQDEGSRDSIVTHNRICKRLSETGKFEEDEE